MTSVLGICRRMLAAGLCGFAIVLSAVAAEKDEPAKMKLGREVFTRIAVPQCGICHTLKDAGTTGEIGIKLEELRPDAARVETAVRKGLGVMPPYTGKLTEEQIQAVAHYVFRASRKD